MSAYRQMGGAGRRAAGELEAVVLAALWSAGTPMTAAQVRAELPGELAYTTVLTTLSRLYDKGVLARRRSGRGYAYQPVDEQAAHTAGRMRALLDRDPDRAAVLSRFVSELSTQDERLLLSLLAAEDQGEAGPDGGPVGPA